MIFSDHKIFHYSLLIFYLIGPPTFISLKFLQAPYGKYNRPGWGTTIYPPLAWFLMESPTLWLTLLLFPSGQHSSNPKSLILISPFLLHYFQRTILYPLRLHRLHRNFTVKPTTAVGVPATVALMAFGYNILNAYIQARWVSHYKNYDDEPDGRFWGKFVVGLFVFGLGMWINVWADGVLVGLKKMGRGYQVPRGGCFELVSCPNYFGELVEWAGWAVMTWSWAGLGFFIFTFANLVPRASAYHKWYLEKFGEDYPKGRKVVIPLLY